MKLNSLIILCLINSLEAQGDDSDVLLELNGDVKKVYPHQVWTSLISGRNSKEKSIFTTHWDSNEDGEFGKKYETQPKVSSWKHELNPVYKESTASDFIEPSEPSRLLQPPLSFYSASIHDFQTENSSPSTSLSYELQPTKSYDTNSSSIKSLKIYEITSLNSSSLVEKNLLDPSFRISDPSHESKSSDSLRSIILNKNSIMKRINDNRNNKVINNGPNRSVNNRINFIRGNRVKSTNSNRGTRKYQHVDSDVVPSVTKRNWNIPSQRQTWQSPRPTKRTNNFRFVDSANKFGSVPGVPGHDYPIHQEHTHHRLHNSAKRFACPTNPTHVYLPDYASRCQIFYICFGSDVGVPMVCPNGTLFSQELQVCDWWFNVSC